MALIVQKFGGSSVGSIEKIKKVAKKVIKTKNEGNQVVVVVSAMSGTTDHLINLAKEIHPNPSRREMDMMVSTGEQVSIALLAMAMHAENEEAVSFNAWQVGIRTTSDYSKAKILEIDANVIEQALKENNIVVVAGFQGIDAFNNVTTLGRGGSDTTAVAIAAAINADRCDIYTDVDGVYTTDPRIVSNARRLEEITFDEMLEMASLGAKVLHDRSVVFAMKYNVPLRVASSFEEGPGTLIVKETKQMEDIVISGITKKMDETRVNISGIPDKIGVAASIFSRLADHNIHVNMIVQSVGKEGHSQISFTVLNNDLYETKETMERIKTELKASELSYDENIAIVSVIGMGMRSHSGVASKVFQLLAEHDINILLISTSEIKISVVIKKDQADEAIKLLHHKFFD